MTIETLAWTLGALLMVTVAILVAMYFANRSLGKQMADRYAEVVTAQATSKFSESAAHVSDTAVDLADAAIRERKDQYERAERLLLASVETARMFGMGLGAHTGFTYERIGEIVEASIADVFGADYDGPVSVETLRGLVWSGVIDGRAQQRAAKAAGGGGKDGE